MRVRALLLLPLTLTLTRCACDQPPEGDGPDDDCVLDGDCGAGMVCANGACVAGLGEGEGEGEGDGEGEGEGEGEAGGVLVALPSADVEFGAERPGVLVERSITLKNTGTAPLRILQMVIDDDAPTSTFTSDPVGPQDLELAPDAEVGVYLTHTPDDGTPDDADLEIVHSGAGGLLNVSLHAEFKGTPTLSITRDAAVLSPDVLAVGYGSTPMGSAQEVVLYVRNRGGSDSVLTFASATMTPAAGPFTVSVDQPGLVLPAFDAFCAGLQECAPSASACTAGTCRAADGAPLDTVVVRVRFAPESAGDHTGTLTLALDSQGDVVQQDLALTGTGTLGNLLVTPGAVSFPSAFVGRTSTQQLTIENVGGSNESIVGLALASGAAWQLQHALSFPAVLVPGGQATLTVSIDPAAAGSFDDVLTIDALNSDDVAVTLQAEARAAPAITAPDSLDLGMVYVAHSAQRTLPIRNLGPGTLSVESISLSGAGAARFAVSAPALPTTVDPLADPDDAAPNLTVTVTYNGGPQYAPPDTATLRIVSDDPDAPYFDVELTGQTVQPDIALSATTVDFGTLDVGTSDSATITVTNAGFGPLVIASIDLPAGAFSVVPSVAIPAVLTTYQSLSLEVTFNAADPGNAASTLTIANNDATDPAAVITLLGRGRTCDPLFGTNVAQSGNTCTYSCAAGYVDLDGDLNTTGSDGCEYECTVIAGVDLPEADAPFTDQNCDGIDGDLAGAVFVSPLGNDSDPGTRDQPVRSIDLAYAQAVSAGLDVYVAGGTYALASTLNLSNGVGIYAGFESSDWDRSDVAIGVVQVANRIALRAQNLSQTTVIDRLDVAGQNATVEQSAYAVLVTGTSNLTFRSSTLRAGRGGDGLNGTSPSGTGVAGGDGLSGEKGCEDSSGACASCAEPNGGGGGTSTCGATGGRGGDPGHEDGAGDSGSPGSGGAAGGDGISAGRGNSDPPLSGWGDDGANGAAGVNGVAGASSYASTGYAPSDGGDGALGTHGAGGGGGGGGGGGSSWCDSYGAGGGGGGAGGCRGAIGTGASSGGGSFALYAWASTISVVDCTLVTGAGGAGGVGGTGQPGGAGGDGYRRALDFPTATAPNAGNASYGDDQEQDDGSNGGRGGDGGDGGRGGHGGSGAGGPSVGIVVGGGASVSQIGNTFTLGIGGTGGNGAGNDGAAGARVQTLTP